MMMKISKSKSCKSAVSQEECGVWLDAVELRAKKQRKLTRPISKLLKPLARSGNYSVGVALSFTQTKMEIPAKKQSRISSFFVPQSKKKMDDVTGCSSLIEKQEYNVDAGVSQEICSPATVTADDDGDDDVGDKEKQFLHLIWGYQADECEPAGKQPCENIQTVTDTQRDPSTAMDYHNSSEEIPENGQTHRQTRQNFQMLRNIYNENDYGSSPSLSIVDPFSQKPLKDQSVKEKRTSCLTPRSNTETQNKRTNDIVKFSRDPELIKQMQRWSPIKVKNKENRHSLTKSSVTHSPSNQLAHSISDKWASDFNRKLCRTPEKSLRHFPQNDEDSLGMLFTQDSEGFRVISHRSKHSRCPLKDETNTSVDRDPSSSLFVSPMNTEKNTDVDVEMLFTQDSQGNIVIKH